jgi:hypothetical protein
MLMHTIPIASLIEPTYPDPDESTRVLEEVSKVLQSGEAVCLDFEGVKGLTAPFLMEAVGPLYGQFTKDFLDTHLTWRGLDETTDRVLRYIREKALFFYRQPEAVQEELVKSYMHPVEYLNP